MTVRVDLFRAEAVEHFFSGEEKGEVLAIGRPRTKAMFIALCILIIGCVVLATFGRVDTTVGVRGVLRPRGMDGRLQLVCFLSAGSRASVAVGDIATVDLDRVSARSLQRLSACVTSVGDGLASSREMREALGEDARVGEPGFRVALTLLPNQPLPLDLKPGVHASVHFVLRHQRVLGLLSARGR
jgi:hypothetical protein